MTEDEDVLIDSNILVYAYDNDEKEKNPIAKNLIAKILSGEMEIYLSTQNLSEFYYNATIKIKQPFKESEAKEIVSGIVTLSNVKIVKINGNTILKAINISSEYNVSYWDALIAAVMKENNIQTIITENEKDFKKIPWLNVFNPFTKNKNNGFGIAKGSKPLEKEDVEHEL